MGKIREILKMFLALKFKKKIFYDFDKKKLGYNFGAKIQN